MKSKYLNQTFDGWTVVDMIRTKGPHTTYVLMKKTKKSIQTMTLRDTALTNLRKGLRTVDQYIAGKAFEVRKNIRVVQNTVKYF